MLINNITAENYKFGESVTRIVDISKNYLVSYIEVPSKILIILKNKE